MNYWRRNEIGRSEHPPPQTSLSAFRLVLSVLFSWIAYASVQVQRSKQNVDLDLASSIAHTYWTSDSAEQVACLSSRATQFASLKIRRLQRQVAFVNLIQVFVRLIGPARLGPRPNLEPSDLDSEKNRHLSSQKCFNFRGVLIGDKKTITKPSNTIK